jgi:hypothetical protein
MEYNVPLIVNGSTYRVTARPLGDPEQPFAPCTEIGEKFRTSCYHELPQWWNQVYSGSFERMGVLCASVVQPEQRRNCFAGIGNIAGSVAGYDADAVIALCGKMPDTGRDTCLLNAAWSFTANVNEPESALHVCKEISEASRQRCIDSL